MKNTSVSGAYFKYFGWPDAFANLRQVFGLGFCTQHPPFGFAAGIKIIVCVYELVCIVCHWRSWCFMKGIKCRVRCQICKRWTYIWKQWLRVPFLKKEGV